MRFWISNKLPSDADVAGPGSVLNMKARQNLSASVSRRKCSYIRVAKLTDCVSGGWGFSTSCWRVFLCFCHSLYVFFVIRLHNNRKQSLCIYHFPRCLITILLLCSSTTNWKEILNSLHERDRKIFLWSDKECEGEGLVTH